LQQYLSYCAEEIRKLRAVWSHLRELLHLRNYYLVKLLILHFTVTPDIAEGPFNCSLCC